MGREYQKRTGQRRRKDRHLSVRAERRDSPDPDRLTELLIRLTLHEAGERRAWQRRRQPFMADVDASS